MRYRIGQWVAFSSIGRDRDIVGKVVPCENGAVVAVETRDGCERGQSRTVTFHEDAPWFPSPVRWKILPNGRKAWEYAR